MLYCTRERYCLISTQNHTCGARASIGQEGAIVKGHLLDHLHEVAALVARGRVGLLLDLDGTISEMVPEANAARVSLSVGTALQDVHTKLSLVAVVTGRPASQAKDLVGVPEITYVGNHGLELLRNGHLTVAKEVRPFAQVLEQLEESLRARFPLEGLIVESKGASFAVHTRLAKEPGKVQGEVLQAIQELSPGQVKVVMGKSVINVLPPVSLNKGTAAVSLIKEYGLSGGIFIGDDLTDLDLFRAGRKLSEGGGFASMSIGVLGPDSPPELRSEVDFTLSSVSEVEAFLSWLVVQKA